MERLRRFLTRRAEAGIDLVAVTHKGVMRSAVSLATDWDMIQTPPIKILPGYALAADVGPSGEMANIRSVLLAA